MLAILFFLFVRSLQAGKLLPYQRYLLYKPVLKHRDVFYHSKQQSVASDVPACDTDNATNRDTANSCSGEINSMFETNSTEECDISDVQTSYSSTSINTGEVSGCGNVVPSVPFAATMSIGDSNDGSPTSSKLTAENRKRVQEFYNHSRLHYISTWCIESKAFVAALQDMVQ